MRISPPLFCLLVSLVARTALAQSASGTADDPYIWLEEKDGAKAMEWVAVENAKTIPRLENDPRYATYYKDAYAIASAEDRIPYPDLTNGRVLNFWRDGEHPHGVWRATTEAGYRTATPPWKTLLDVDSLGKAEGKNWVWEGANCLQPEERLCLIALSDGGEDAVTFREFDLTTAQFVKDGFVLPQSKQDASWLDANTLLVARDWGAGTMTASGYPFVVKRVVRGQPLDQAVEVFRGAETDQGGSGANILTDGQGHTVPLLVRGVTFFGRETFLLTPGGPVKLPLPEKYDIRGMVDGRVIIKTSEDWTPSAKMIPAGALVSVDRTQLNGGPIAPTVMFQPGPRQSVDQAAATRTNVVLVVLDNVINAVSVYTPGAKGWTSAPVKLPANTAIAVAASTDRSEQVYLSVTGFLNPTTLWSLDAKSGALAQVKALPARFDATHDMVEQFQATSTDGTKIPYFIVHKKDLPLDGSTPTIMTAYGGFEISYTPWYSATTGKLWLENGGSFAVANIRGGGEFGPAWHEAGRKDKAPDHL